MNCNATIEQLPYTSKRIKLLYTIPLIKPLQFLIVNYFNDKLRLKILKFPEPVVYASYFVIKRCICHKKWNDISFPAIKCEFYTTNNDVIIIPLCTYQKLENTEIVITRDGKLYSLKHIK
jgi:hypothetical protein